MEYRNRNIKVPDILGKKKIPKEDAEKALRYVTVLPLYVYKGERFRNKQEKINEWIARDTEKQERFDQAIEPSSTFCEKCSEVMVVNDKILEDYLDKPLKVLFILECPKCHKRKGVYGDGSDYEPTSNKCPKCSSELGYTSSRKGKIIKTTFRCPNCKYIDIETYDLYEKNGKWEKQQEVDRKLLARYRGKYCLSEKEGNEYITSMDQIKWFLDQRSEEQKKETDPVYQKVKKIKKITVVELEKMLGKLLSREGFIRLSFEKPEISKQVVIPFTAQDSNSKREGTSSTATFQKLIKKALSATNWRLMSEGTTYRLGYVSGRLKGYETEEDLYKLINSSKY